jgi:hypothetical protein
MVTGPEPVLWMLFMPPIRIRYGENKENEGHIVDTDKMLEKIFFIPPDVWFRSLSFFQLNKTNLCSNIHCIWIPLEEKS